jgi:acetyl-CoA carboxylase carboxyltransferase component
MLAGVLDIDALTKAAQLGYIDEIIKPEETRKKLIQAWE